ncbi:hypothetical protein Tco_1216876 [Tanacetum coccineum]
MISSLPCESHTSLSILVGEVSEGRWAILNRRMEGGTGGQSTMEDGICLQDIHSAVSDRTERNGVCSGISKFWGVVVLELANASGGSDRVAMLYIYHLSICARGPVCLIRTLKHAEYLLWMSRELMCVYKERKVKRGYQRVRRDSWGGAVRVRMHLRNGYLLHRSGWLRAYVFRISYAHSRASGLGAMQNSSKYRGRKLLSLCAAPSKVEATLGTYYGAIGARHIHQPRVRVLLVW